MSKKWLACAVWVLTLIMFAPVAEAQNASSADVPIAGFRLGPPGARALGMGSTFIAIADDATASEANPAGLIQLTSPQLSGHFRVSKYDTQARFAWDNTVETFSSDQLASISFASFVYPFEKAAISVFYQETVNFENAFSFATTDPSGDFRVTQDIATKQTLRDVLAVAGAARLGDWVSVGGAVRFSKMDLSTAETFDYVFLPEGSLTAENEFLTDTAGGSDNDVTFNIGALVNPDGAYRAGFVFKRGPEFRATTSTGFSCFGTLAALCGPPTQSSFGFDFKTPSVFGGGFSARPLAGLVLGVDIVRITYSDLEIAEFDEFQDAIDDGTEVHIGGEYTFLSLSSPLTVRAGFYNDPDHDGLDAVDSSDKHFTFGGGVVIGEQVQIDGAANIADQVKEFLFSIVVEIR